MKRLITTSIVILTFFISVSAQNDHMEITKMFGGFTITGTVDSFKEQRESYFSMGIYSVVETNNDINCTLIKGIYMGKPECLIGLFCTPISNIIYKVAIDFESWDSWSLVDMSYKTLRKYIEEEYGSPTYTKEYFLAPYKNGDGYELEAFHLQKASYITLWTTDKGNIVLRIVSNGTIGTVEIIFQDKKGEELYKQESKEATHISEARENDRLQ